MHFGKPYVCSNQLMCKKQTAVSHSSAESEIISLDAGLRMDGLLALGLWDLVIEVLGMHHRIPNPTQVYLVPSLGVTESTSAIDRPGVRNPQHFVWKDTNHQGMTPLFVTSLPDQEMVLQAHESRIACHHHHHCRGSRRYSRKPESRPIACPAILVPNRPEASPTNPTENGSKQITQPTPNVKPTANTVPTSRNRHAKVLRCAQIRCSEVEGCSVPTLG